MKVVTLRCAQIFMLLYTFVTILVKASEVLKAFSIFIMTHLSSFSKDCRHLSTLNRVSRSNYYHLKYSKEYQDI